MIEKILGYDWSEIQRIQQGGPSGTRVNLKDGDYGADPLGDGTFRMIPSGDIVDFEERNKRLNVNADR